MPQLDLHIDKMHCGACVRRVTQTLNAIPGTHANSVTVGAANITSEAPEQALEALAQAGFPAQLAPSHP